MKKELKDFFNDMAKMTGQSAENFIEIFETPDDEFDKTYPLFKKALLDFYGSPDYQNDLVNKMRLLPVSDIEKERELRTLFLEQVDSDETLSPNKRDLFHVIMDSAVDVLADLIDCKRIRVDVNVVRLNPDAIIPEYAHSTDAGADIFAIEDTVIAAGETKLVKTGLAVAIPEGYEIQVRPRSGLSLKSPLRVANAPGTIDSSYRGEICVIMTNTSADDYVIHKHDKIAQMLIAPTPMIRWNECETVEELGETTRGTGGFGSTDKS